jgi:hypothetical protein
MLEGVQQQLFIPNLYMCIEDDRMFEVSKLAEFL